MENYTGSVTLKKLSHGSPSSPRVKGLHPSFFLLSGLYQRCYRKQSSAGTNGSAYVFVLPVCYANITGVLSRSFNLSEVPVEWPAASRE